VLERTTYTALSEKFAGRKYYYMLDVTGNPFHEQLLKDNDFHEYLSHVVLSLERRIENGPPSRPNLDRAQDARMVSEQTDYH
jgi:hypothetical protein